MPVTAAQRLMDAFRRLWRRAFGAPAPVDPYTAIERKMRRLLNEQKPG